MDEPTYNDIAAKAGISRSYACEIVNGKRRPSLATALRIYDATGLRFGQLAGLGKRDIEAARRMVGR